MKNYTLCLFLCCIAGFCSAQDTVKATGPELIERTNDPSSNIHEKYTVLKTDKKVKHGLFQAFYNGKTLVAAGKYDNGVKTGVWRYFNEWGSANQVYSYTNKKLIYNKKADTAFVQFDFDGKINATDTLTYPVKIGGSMYGYRFIVEAVVKKFSLDMRSAGTTTEYRCVHILSIDANGALTRWQLLATNAGFKKLYEVPMDQLKEEDKLFVPATQNGKPVPSTAYVKIFVGMFSPTGIW
jgi:hypothetical protein